MSVKGSGKTITFKCDCCGKEKTVPTWRYRGKLYHTCSDECRYKKLKEHMTKVWGELTPEKRKEWASKVGHGKGNGEGLRNYHRTMRPARVAKVIEIMTTPVGEIQPGERYQHRGVHTRYNPRFDKERYIPMGTCTLIAAHHELLKDDPERLSTEFMQKMCRVECKCKTKAPEESESKPL
jgi:hypothetical protein